VAVVQLNFLLNTYLASFQPEGSVTAINLAFPLMIMPQVAIAQSVAIAALPTFSAQFSHGKLDEMRHSLAATLRGVLLLAIPASIGLILLRKPLIQLIYQGGQFTSQSTDMVAWALLWYAIGLVGHSVVEITSRAFYALHDTKTPVFVGIAAMTLNLIFSLLFTRVFRLVGWMPHGGLALANSLATMLEMVGLYILMSRRLDGLEGRRISQGVLISILAAAGMSLFIVIWVGQANTIANIWLLLSSIVGSVVVYFGILSLLKVNELNIGFQWLKSKMPLRKSKGEPK